MGEEESEIAVPPLSSLLAGPLASSSGGGAGAARVAGMRVRGQESLWVFRVKAVVWNVDFEHNRCLGISSKILA